METIWTDRLITETGCMLYMRIVSTTDDITVYAFKHDELRCDFQIFTGIDYKGNLESWLLEPVETSASY
jgi:hypothetical protein